MGVITTESFSLAKGGKLKHRLFPLPVGWMTRVLMSLMTVVMVSSCHFLNAVKPKYFTSNPSSLVSLSSVNGSVKVGMLSS